jgi:hypothetical protein
MCMNQLSRRASGKQTVAQWLRASATQEATGVGRLWLSVVDGIASASQGIWSVTSDDDEKEACRSGDDDRRRDVGC